MRRANLNGVVLEWEAVGSGEPVLLISPVLADGFVPLVSEPALSEHYRLITYHKRGWRGSTHTAQPVSVEVHAQDAAALLDRLGVGRAHVVGHSSGAAVALQLALERPHLVHTLSLLELSLFSVPRAEELFQKARPALEAYAAGDHAAAVAGFMRAVSGLEWTACAALLERRMPGSVDQAVADADTFFGTELPALTQWSFGPEQAAAIRQPALSVLGADTEPLWVDVAACLRSWLPHVEECAIDRIGHLLHIQRPEPVARCIADFLRRHPLSIADGSSASRDARTPTPHARPVAAR